MVGVKSGGEVAKCKQVYCDPSYVRYESLSLSVFTPVTSLLLLQRGRQQGWEGCPLHLSPGSSHPGHQGQSSVSVYKEIVKDVLNVMTHQ